MVSLNENVRLINSFSDYVNTRNENITDEDRDHINSRIELLVDTTAFKLTGRRLFQDTYRVVDEPPEDVVMNDINIDGVDLSSESPMAKVMPADVSIKKRDRDTSFLDKLKIPTLAIPVLPTLALSLGSGVATGTMLSLGAMLLDLLSLLPGARPKAAPKPKRKPKSKPKTKKPPKGRWWTRLKKGSIATKLMIVWESLLKSKYFPSGLVDWIMKTSQDVGKLGRHVYNLFNSRIKEINNMFDNFMSTVKKLYNDIYTQINTQLKAIAKSLLEAKKILPDFIKNSTKWGKEFIESFIKTTAGSKWFKMMGRGVGKALGPLMVVVDGYFAYQLNEDLTNAADNNVDADGQKRGGSELLNQEVDNRTDSALGVGLSVLDPLGAAVVISNQYEAIIDQSKYYAGKKSRDVDGLLDTQKNYMDEVNSMSDQELAEQVMSSELRPFLESGSLSEDRYAEMLTNPGLIELAAAVRRYNLNLLLNQSTARTILSNYNPDINSGYQKNYFSWWNPEKRSLKDKYNDISNKPRMQFLNFFTNKPTDQSVIGLKPEDLSEFFQGDNTPSQYNQPLIKQHELDGDMDLTNLVDTAQRDFDIDDQTNKQDDDRASYVESGLRAAANEAIKISKLVANMQIINSQKQKELQAESQQQILEELQSRGIVTIQSEQERSDSISRSTQSLLTGVPVDQSPVSSGADISNTNDTLMSPVMSENGLVVQSGRVGYGDYAEDGSSVSADLLISTGVTAEQLKQTLEMIKSHMTNRKESRQTMISALEELNLKLKNSGSTTRIIIPESIHIRAPQLKDD